MKFTQPFFSFQQQTMLLAERGLIIENDTVHYLQHLNDYRLSGYWIPFQQDNKTHHFKNRLITLMKKHDIPVGAMGFPANWQQRSVWSAQD